jgi:hypothetical protein
MKIRFAVLDKKIITVEVIIMGSGTINIKVVEPNHPNIPSDKFNKRHLYSSKREAENYLKTI